MYKWRITETDKATGKVRERVVEAEDPWDEMAKGFVKVWGQRHSPTGIKIRIERID